MYRWDVTVTLGLGSKAGLKYLGKKTLVKARIFESQLLSNILGTRLQKSIQNFSLNVKVLLLPIRMKKWYKDIKNKEIKIEYK